MRGVGRLWLNVQRPHCVQIHSIEVTGQRDRVFYIKLRRRVEYKREGNAHFQTGVSNLRVELRREH